MYRAAMCFIGLAAIVGRGHGQQMRATMVGGGSADRGKCTIEVVVDGTAEVEIRGDQASLRNLGGQPPQWRRFQCTGPLPSRPAEFRFAGVDGRGHQELVRDPRQGGTAVVRIEDKSGGAEGYTFDLIWDGGGGGYENPPARGPRTGGGGAGRRMATAEAVRVCQDAVRAEAAQRYRGEVQFLEGRVDDNPGRNDWIVGRIAVGRGRRQDEMNYSCSVDFDNGRVRSARIETPVGSGSSDRGYDATQLCRQAVSDRIRREGYGRVEFSSMDNRGRGDSMAGIAQAYHGPNFDAFGFSCSIDPGTGEIRNVDVRRR